LVWLEIEIDVLLGFFINEKSFLAFNQIEKLDPIGLAILLYLELTDHVVVRGLIDLFYGAILPLGLHGLSPVQVLQLLLFPLLLLHFLLQGEVHGALNIGKNFRFLREKGFVDGKQAIEEN
jgi:hypothetical protein